MILKVVLGCVKHSFTEIEC